MDIEYAIKELRDSYELHQLAWAKRCLDTIEDELEKKNKIIEDIKFINNNNKPHIAQQKIRDYFTNKVEEDK